MGPVLLLPPVAEVLVHPPTPTLLDRPLHSTPPSPPPPTGPRALAHLDGHERGYLQHVLSRRPAKALLPPPHPPPPSSLAISLFSFVQPVLPGACVIYSSLGDMWSLCWIPRTPGSQCFLEEEEEREEGKQCDASSQLSGRSVQAESVQIWVEKHWLAWTGTCL